METEKTVWVTKYALTRGIETAKGNYRKEDDRFITSSEYAYEMTWFHREGHEFHLTEKSAKVRADEMRKNKMESLKKQLAKLKAMKF